ncbi:VirB6/TrbL-like conjugal transfer protein, CD1112 family [Butyrivibrio sp. JL13D10]|uniref:VirB6/TrbL-like conjugal transfer protein, CD1112 family n=1 Tax=Butyrivibrio sp. JL13D10 TaxID=3236815 RepID=UPI0038B646E3
MFDELFAEIEQHLKDMIIPYLMSVLQTMFDCVNDQVGTIASDVGTTPSAFNPTIFGMIRNISESVIMPIAGIILTFVACYELIQLIISYNNLANFETWFIFKWVFKTFIAVEIITHTFDFTLAVFDVAQHVILNAGGVIVSSTAVDASALASMQSTIEAMDIWSIFALFFQVSIIMIVTQILSKLIFVIIYVRMIEIYMYVSLAPIPLATFANKEQSSVCINYGKSLFALGLQGFLIMICVGIYAALIQSLAFSSDIVGSLWGVVGYTILLAFSLFKTNTVAKAILQCT